MSLHVHKLALGTVQFGLDYGISNTTGKTDDENIKSILRLASENGINMLDTAADYGDAEKRLGDLAGGRFDIVTKFSPKANTADSLMASFNNSLLYLRVQALYGLLAHNADALLDNPALWAAAGELKKEGKVKKIGYSLYTPAQLMALLDKNFIPDIVQVPFSFLDTRFKPHFTLLKSIGVEVHIRSVFLQGLFFMDADGLPAHFDAVKPVLKQLHDTFKTGEERSAFLLLYALREPQIDKVVFGVNTAEQLAANLSSIAKPPAHPDIHLETNIADNILMPQYWPAKNMVRS